MVKHVILSSLLVLAVFNRPVKADNADVLDADIRDEGDSRFTFTVTVRHNDTGWDHYADRWEILTLDDQIIAARVLRHPHTGEQPFTRSLPYVPIPDEITRVKFRAHCSRDGYVGNTLEKALPAGE